MGEKDIDAAWFLEQYLRTRLAAGWDSIPDSKPSDEKPTGQSKFPRWQPVKCTSPKCDWHGPFSKAKDFGDGEMRCPKCWCPIEEHKSKGTNP